MIINIHITLDEYKEMTKLINNELSGKFNWPITIGYIGVLTLLFMLSEMLHLVSRLIAYIIIGTMTATLMVVNYSIIKMQKKVIAKASKCVLGDFKYEFTKTAIIDEGKYSSGKMSWECIEEIFETKTHFILMLETVRGICIPKKDVGTENEIGKLRAIFVERKGKVRTITL